MAEQIESTVLTGKGFAKVQFLTIVNDVKIYLEKGYPIKFVYRRFSKEQKFTYSYPRFISLIKEKFGDKYFKKSKADKNLISSFAQIEEAVASKKISEEYIVNMLTKSNNINDEFPEFCKILTKALNNFKDAPVSTPAAQSRCPAKIGTSLPAEQSSGSFGKRPPGAKPKI